ncbi:MAG: Rne/Rng family ribonuclease [Candidatus Omnitrophica bacterium]|nr:Rne/Rng family ribonuclease [Candidatus Omnitrophota bacterium]
MTARRRTKKKPPEKKGKEILVNVGPAETRVVVLESGKMIDFFMERKSLEHYAGSIYKGKVTAIVPGIEAAFVDIGMEKNGFLHVGDVVDKTAVLKEMLADEDEPDFHAKRKPTPKIENILKKGEEIMVQVVKESIGTKGPRLTTYISIPGRYVVLTPHDKNTGISRRITEKDERKRIRDIIRDVALPEKSGCIVRTVAENRTKEELRNELKYLANLWERVKSRADRQNSPVTVYEEYGIVLRMIRDNFTEDVTQLIVDSKEEYGRIIKFLKAFMPALRRKVKLYTGLTPLFEKHNLDKKVDEIFERKVSLKSGGYLIIEQTEGVVVIDVNTGRFTGKKSLEETAFKTNVEAAEEIPTQLMLRDIGGIVIIDFIDMDQKGHRDKTYHALQNKLHNDKARISLRDISQFGVVEMTRQRMRKSVEGTSHVECPYCGGKGMIKSVETIAIEVARRIDKLLTRSDKKLKHITVRMHPDINAILVSDQARVLRDIQRKYRCKIDLKEDSSLHIEDFVIDEH